MNILESGKREFFVVGVTHIDLAWKRGAAEMTEMLEIFVIRLLDALDSEPDFRYMIEQAAHYRTLATLRPDLIERLKLHLQSGRLEMVGGMASTLETNLPNGESFVRNQMIGMKWVRENLGVGIKTGWLIDTFGIHAQTPQIFQQFGLNNLMANRFGGATFHDIFRAKGLDGSEILIVGRETYSAFVRRENTLRTFYHDWDGVEKLFRDADELPGDGPILLIPYVENEMMLSLRPLRLAQERAKARPNESWSLATPCEYIAALEAASKKTGREWPVLSADLNPEFTGCFSLRPKIRLRNRRAETLLLEAEKWLSLQRMSEWEAEIEQAWWQVAFLQFHDVFTGSHPTAVYNEVMRIYAEVEAAASRLLQSALENLSPTSPAVARDDTITISAFNGLPWERRDVVTIPLPETITGVPQVTDSAGKTLPSDVRDGALQFLARLPAVGKAAFLVENGTNRESASASRETAVDRAIIENDYLSLEADNEVGIRRLLWKPTGAIIMENAGDFLVAQRDDGSFQIESPNGAEVAAAAGTIQAFQQAPSAFSQTLRLSGAFPSLSWAGTGNLLTWEAEFCLITGKPMLVMKIRLNWKGEGSRLRLKLATKIDSSEGIFEIPFGTVKRKPYGIRGNARGEWPAHRFVALEDAKHGIALANTGVGGVEIGGGTLWTTLLRAPKATEVGMIPDDTSSQHGAHEFDFALIPYAGSWSQAGVAAFAQELNNPVRTMVRSGKSETTLPSSFLRIEGDHIILSAVKAAEEGSGELVVRLYETAGLDKGFTLTIPQMTHAWESDLREQKGEPIPVTEGRLTLQTRPYEIKTICLRRV